MNEEHLSHRIKVFLQVMEAIPELRYAGDPLLRQKAELVSVEDAHPIAAKLQSVLKRYRMITGLGRGIAAPQIGINKQVFVTFVDDRFEVFVNPRIVEVAPTTNFYRELCMSVGLMSVDVERPEWIVMEWIDLDGHTHRERFNDLKARLYQHEEAHLRGILNLDEAVQGGISFILSDPAEEKLRPTRA